MCRDLFPPRVCVETTDLWDFQEVPETEGLLATLREERRVMRRDQFRARVERRHQHALMKGGPVKRRPKLPCDGAFRVIAVAAQVGPAGGTLR
jgi:hypothetical protein